MKGAIREVRPGCSRRRLVTGGLTLLGIAILASGCTSASETRSQDRPVLVAGATGQTGRLVVTELQAQGYPVRALVRDAARARDTLGDGVELVEGDVKDPASLERAMAGAGRVIATIGAAAATGPDRPEMIDYQGVRNLAAAAAGAGVEHFVLVSSRSVTQPDHPLNRLFGDVLRWKLEGENALRASGVPYTIIRPGGLLNGPAGEKTLVVGQGDTVTAQTTMTRADLAVLTVAALRYAEARNRTFETHTVAGPPVTDWRALFAALEPD